MVSAVVKVAVVVLTALSAVFIAEHGLLNTLVVQLAVKSVACGAPALNPVQLMLVPFLNWMRPGTYLQEGSCEYNAFGTLMMLQSPAHMVHLDVDDDAKVSLMRKAQDGIGDMFPVPRWCVKAHAEGLDDPKTVETEHAHYGKLEPSYWVRDNSLDNASAPILIYYHGGAYVTGKAQDYAYVGCVISRHLRVRVLVAQYPLAPEFPMPAAVEVSANLFQRVQQRIPDAKVFLGGESAGGGMALLVMQRAIQVNSALPTGALLLSPWASTDFESIGPSLEANNGRDPMANMPGVRFVTRAATGWQPEGSEQYNRLTKTGAMSPLFGNLTGLPPMFISAGEADVLVSCQRALRDKALLAGVDAQYSERQGMGHVYQIFIGVYKEATEEFDLIREFVHKLL